MFGENLVYRVSCKRVEVAAKTMNVGLEKNLTQKSVFLPGILANIIVVLKFRVRRLAFDTGIIKHSQ